MYPQLKMWIKRPDDSLAKAQFGLINLKHFLSTLNT